MAKPDAIYPRGFESRCWEARHPAGPANFKDVFERASRRASAINPLRCKRRRLHFGEQEGEAIYLDALDAKTTKEDDFILLAGTPEGAQKAYGLAAASNGRLRIVDCTGQLEQRPEAHTVAPLVNDVEPGLGWLFVTAHPVAAALTLALRRLARYRTLNRIVANVFEPASERGKPAPWNFSSRPPAFWHSNRSIGMSSMRS